MQRKRDDEAFMAALTKHHDALARFARLLTRSHDDAQDLTAETVLKALESWHTVREPDAFRTFLFRIAHRLAIRHNFRHRLFDRIDDGMHDTFRTSEPSPERSTDAALVRDHLKRMSAAHRESLVLVDVLGWTLEDVVAVQGGTVGGLKARLFRARQDLIRRTGGSNEVK